MNLFKKKKKGINHITLVIEPKISIDYPTFMPIPRIGETINLESKYYDGCGLFKVTNVLYIINDRLDYTAIEISCEKIDRL